MKIKTSTTTSLVWLAGGLISCVSAKAILGVDLGSLYMKVALVQRGAPLEIVTNLHSKRKTEQMILFDQGSRFYGADASSLVARKPTQTPLGMSVMLGRDEDHPAVKAMTDRHFPLTPLYNETRKGLYLSVNGKDSYTPEELVAMVFGHAKEITHAYGEEKGHTYGTIQDCVLTVPSFATQVERQALLDAAELADMHVLSLIDENTAAALNFGMDKLNEEPQIILFYNLGASSLQVSLVKFHTYEMPEGKYSKKTKTVGSIEVLGKAWDATLGGQEFDNVLVEYMADHFNREWRHARGHEKDVRDVPRAMTKMRLQANKVKHVLSANQQIPIHMDSVHDDMSLSLHITREQLEDLCNDLYERSVKPVTQVLAMANVTLDEVTAIEMIGGAMRVPKVQTELSKALGGKELGMHINSDESMALGAAFFGANISTAFRVRHVGLTDINSFPVGIALSNLATEEKKSFFGGGKKKEDAEEGEEWNKSASVFKAGGKTGVKKTIAFTHDKDVHCAVDYEDSEQFPEGTQKTLQRYNITGVAEFAKEMEEKGLGKPKLSLHFEMTHSGITQLVKAEAAVEETYTVEEEEEVDDDKADAEATSEEEKKEEPSEEEKKEEATAEEGEAKPDVEGEKNETKTEEKPAKKKKKTIMVEKMFGFRRKNPAFVPKEKKRTIKKVLGVVIYHVGKVQPYSDDIFAESKTKMAELDLTDQERIKLEAAKNKVESYIYLIKNKLIDDEENINKVSTEEQRESLRSMGMEAEEWLDDDGYKADYATMVAKYADISSPAEKVWLRVKEMTARPAAAEALKAKLVKIQELMKKWETSMPQVTEEEKAEVFAKVEEVTAWIAEKEAAQAEVAAHEDPVFISDEVPLQMKPLEKLCSRLSKKPKPKPIVKKKNETAAGAGNETDAGAETEDLDAEEPDAEEPKADAEEPEADAEEATEEASESESPKLEAEGGADEEL